MADLLEGRSHPEARQASAQVVEPALKSLNVPPGKTLIGSQVYAACLEGQNNWKVHEGYRLSCWVAAQRFLAWHGDFTAGTAAIDEALEAQCGPRLNKVGNYKPKPGNYSDGGIYQCGERKVVVYWETTVDLQTSTSIVDTVNDQESRYISGITPSEAKSALTGYDWFSVESIQEGYFKDAP